MHCQICKASQHEALSYPHQYNHAYNLISFSPALAALTLNDPSNSIMWLPDTGAGAHMTNNVGILHNLRPYHGNMHVAVGNGDILDITYTGDTCFIL